MAAISPDPIGSVFLLVAIIAIAGCLTLSVRRRTATVQRYAGIMSLPVVALPTVDGFADNDRSGIESEEEACYNPEGNIARLQLEGIAGRQWMMGELASAIDKARSSGRSLSIVTFTIDHFKAIESTHGRRAADKAVVKVAEIATRLAGQNDIVSSIGHGAFLWILPQCGAADAFKAMQRLVWAVQLGTHSAPVLSVTVSAGSAQWSPSMDATGLVDEARNALLQPEGVWFDGFAIAA